MKILISIAKIVLFVCVWAGILYLTTKITVSVAEEVGVEKAFCELIRQAFAFIIAALMVCLMMLFVDKGTPLPKVTERPARDILLGLFTGAFWIGITLVLFIITDSLFPGSRHWPSYLVVWGVSILLNVLTQELMLRGYIFSVVESSSGPATAIMVSSIAALVFQGRAFENGAVSVIFTVSAALLYGILRYYTGGLLAPIIVHFVWNIIGGLVMGLINLGFGYSELRAASISGEDILSGGHVGFEGSALSVIICILLIDLILIFVSDRQKNNKDPKEQQL